ncbi:aconitase family protein, partial [Salmonella enterica subsp. enterica serovar Typhimurium]|nr:aconitase family protein [Salmonella enterica subsp. enterica serovar Typhimurium]
TTFTYLKGRRHAPQGEDFLAAVEKWKQLCTDPGATYDHVVEIDAAAIAPQVTWGTSPGMGTDITSAVPNPESFASANDRKAAS